MKVLFKIVFVFAFLFSLNELAGKTFKLNPQNTAAEIQNIIIIANSNDTLVFEDGNYYFGDLGKPGLAIIKPLTLKGGAFTNFFASNKEKTIFSGTILTCYAQNDSLNIVKIYKINFKSSKSKTSGAAIVCYKSFISFEDCNFIQNKSDSTGGAILLAESDCSINKCNFTENKAINGGAIFSFNSKLLIENSTIEKSFSQNGGAIGLTGSEIILNKVAIQGNTSENGGAILAVDSKMNITESLFDSNVGTNGAGIFSSKCTGDFSGNSFVNNNSSEGGAFYLDSTTFAITNNYFTHNRAVGYGGAIYTSNSNGRIEDNIIYQNISDGDGGGIFTFQSSPDIFRNKFVNNSSHGYGGAIYAYGMSNPKIENNLIQGNSSSYGACMYVEYRSHPKLKFNSIIANSARLGGCFVCVEQSQMNVDSCLILDNGSTENERSGIAFIVSNSDSASIANSNLIYNTYQIDKEIDNSTEYKISLENNFWAGEKPENLVIGKYSAKNISSDFLKNVPSINQTIDSIKFYNSRKEEIKEINYLNDSIFITVYGKDINKSFYDAVVILIKTTSTNQVVAVSLTETTRNSGIYSGYFFLKEVEEYPKIRKDDINQIVRISKNDIILFYNYTEQKLITQKMIIIFTDIKESNLYLNNKITLYDLLSEKYINQEIRIYDTLGRLILSKQAGSQLTFEQFPKGLMIINIKDKFFKLFVD
jgi:predicted outer membrane repeat protein